MVSSKTVFHHKKKKKKKKHHTNSKAKDILYWRCSKSNFQPFFLAPDFCLYQHLISLRYFQLNILPQMTHFHLEAFHFPIPKPVAFFIPCFINRKASQVNKWGLSTHTEFVSKLTPLLRLLKISRMCYFLSIHPSMHPSWEPIFSTDLAHLSSCNCVQPSSQISPFYHIL